jgi:hypothetical protein
MDKERHESTTQLLSLLFAHCIRQLNECVGGIEEQEQSSGSHPSFVLSLI